MDKNILIFLPLLSIYLIVIVLFAPALEGDEGRHISYAENIGQGFYTDSNNPELENGPGYPLVLLPFVALNVNILFPRIMNAFFVFIGILYLYKTLHLYTKQKYAIIFAFIVGLYPPLFRWMVLLYSESFAFMLMIGFVFHFCYLYKSKEHKWKNCLLASFYLGFLVITKFIFFHAMIISAILLVILFLTKNKENTRWSTLVLIGATIFILPYVAYAYTLTGKLFYLGTGGGEILYHRSTPFESELGNWFSFDDILVQGIEKNQSNKTYQDLSELSANHRDYYLQLEPLSHMERDSAFQAKAIANMKEYPRKYLMNTISNTGRFLFNYPNSYRSQNLKAYGFIIPNMFILVLFILIIYPAFIARKRIPFEVKAQLIFALIYGCGIILLAGKGRYFILMVPSLVLFALFVYTKVLKISLVKPEIEN